MVFNKKSNLLITGRETANPSIIVLFLAIIANSILFTLESGMDAHIRYALPTYTIILTGLVILFFRYTFCLSICYLRKPDQSIYPKNMNLAKESLFVDSD